MQNIEDNKNYELIVKAAEKCIKKRGVASLRMDAVAKEAKVSRQTVYRTFKDKEELVSAVFEELMLKNMYDELHEVITGLEFEDAIFEGTLVSLRLVREDPLMIGTFSDEDAHWFQERLLDHRTPLHHKVRSATKKLWQDAINEARSAGALNENLTDEEVADWITSMHYLMLARVDATDEDIVDTVYKFLLPPLLNEN